MTNKTYRVGLVGLSGIAAGPPGEDDGPLRDEIRVGHTACLAQTPGVDIVGVCDLSSEMLDKFNDTWGARWPNATRYTDYKEMVDKEGLDILTVATGDDKHADIAVYGATNGASGVFVEKPLATTMEDADRMIAAFDTNGVASSVGHTRRWRPLFHRVRGVLREGTIGPLRNIVALHGGRRAMMFRNGTHIIDGICFFADSEPAQVFARLEEGFEDWDHYKGDGGKLPENEPGVSGFIHFRNGVRAYYSAHKDTMDGVPIELAGPDGKMVFDFSGPSIELRTKGADRAWGAVSQTLVPKDYRTHTYVAAYLEMIDRIENGGEGVSTAREARKTVQIMTGFLKSQAAGGRLVDVPGYLT
jgi:predicted dehydrogenase